MGAHTLSNAQIVAFTALVLAAGYLILVLSNVLAFRAGVAVGKCRCHDLERDRRDRGAAGDATSTP